MPWRDGANVIPFVILDGSGNIVAQFDQNGLQVFGTNGTMAGLLNTTAIAELALRPPTVPGVTWVNGEVVGQEDEVVGDHRGQLVIVSPAVDTGAGYRQVSIFLEGSGQTTPDTDILFRAARFNFRSDQLEDADITLNAISQGRGNRFSAARSTNVTVGAATMVLDATAAGFTWRAGRCYEVVIRGRMGTNTAGNLAIFKLRRGTTTAASVAIDFGGFKCGAVGDLLPVNISALIANPTGADVVQQVQLSLESSAGTVTHDGGTMPRSVTIADVGAATDYAGGGNPAYNTI